jgi:hypothetical protein
MKAKFVAASVLATVFCTTLFEQEAEAQIPPIAERDPNWDAVSSIFMVMGVTSVTLTPRIYYSSPDATVGWKARWHFSMFAPALAMTAATVLVEVPFRDAIQSPKDGCTVGETLTELPDAGCETFGGPSTHAFASWGAFGAGSAIFLVDTFKYSGGEFGGPSVGSLVGNVILPFGAAIMTSVGRSADGRGVGPEGTGQVLAGALPGLGVGALLGLGYSMLQEPDCGYGGFVFCW